MGVIEIDEELVRLAITICDTAIENAQELVAKHDAELGRTTSKNKWLGDRYDQDIIVAKMCKNKFENLLL